MSFPEKFKNHWVGVAAINGLRFFYAYIIIRMPTVKGKKKDTEVNIN